MDAFSLPTRLGSMGMDPHLLLGQANSRDPRLIESAATGFEGAFLSILLKEMRQTLGPDGLFPQDRSEILGGMFDMYLGQHLAQAGAFGIAALLRQQLTGTAANDAPANVAATQPTARAVP